MRSIKLTTRNAKIKNITLCDLNIENKNRWHQKSQLHALMAFVNTYSHLFPLSANLHLQTHLLYLLYRLLNCTIIYIKDALDIRYSFRKTYWQLWSETVMSPNARCPSATSFLRCEFTILLLKVCTKGTRPF